MGRFDGQVAVVTGGATGIGFAISRALAVEGAHVFVAGRNVERGTRAVEQIGEAGSRATFVATDVTDDGQVAALATQAAADHGAIEIWCNNAGMESHTDDFTTVGDHEVRAVLDTNVKGVFSGLRYAVLNMDNGGVIVNTASFVGTKVPIAASVIYGGSKAAVVSMTRSVALGVADKGIDVFAICPYVVDTPMLDRLTGGKGPKARAAMAAQAAPSGRLVTSDQVAEVVVDLCGRTSGYASGDVLLVDAGPTVTTL